MSDPALWAVTVAIDGADEDAEFLVMGRDAAQRVVDKFRDRVEHVSAAPAEVYHGAAPVIREVMRRNGWLGLPRKSPDYREQREMDEASPYWGIAQHPEIIR